MLGGTFDQARAKRAQNEIQYKSRSNRFKEPPRKFQRTRHLFLPTMPLAIHDSLLISILRKFLNKYNLLWLEGPLSFNPLFASAKFDKCE